MHPEPKKQKFSADARVETGIAHDGTVPRSVAFFISLFSGSNRFFSNGYGSLFTAVIDHSFELDTLIPRIPSKWGISKAGVYCALVCFAYHKEVQGERHYRRTLVLVNDGAFKIRAVEAKWETLERSVLIHFATIAQRILSILLRAYRRHNENGVIGSHQIVWMYSV